MALKIFRLPELWNRKDRLGLWRAGKRKSARTILNENENVHTGDYLFFFGELDPDPAAAAVAIVGTCCRRKAPAEAHGNEDRRSALTPGRGVLTKARSGP